MKNLFLITILAVFSLSIYSCQLKRQIRKGDERKEARVLTFDMTTQCLGVSANSNYLIIAFGTGSTKDGRMAQAQMNALKDILFKGLTKGGGGCAQKPMVFDPNKENQGTELISKLLLEKTELATIIFSTSRGIRVNDKSQADLVMSYKMEIDPTALKKYFTGKGLISNAE